MSYFVYILKCNDGSFYTGSTNNLTKRLHAHNHLKNGAHYTKMRRPVELIYSEKISTYKKVRQREAEIKRFDKKDKLALIS